MFRKGSRYAEVSLFENAPFEGTRPRAVTVAEGVIEHRVKQGDRLDLLARHYYNDDRLWWRIVDANPAFLFGGDTVRDGDRARPFPDLDLRGMVGHIILIPRAR